MMAMTRRLRPEASVPSASVQRWNRHHRLQHLLLFLSMTVLILTGFPIKYAYLPSAQWAVQIIGSFKNLYTLHVSAAVLLVLTAVYHLVYLAVYGWRHGVRVETAPMVPGLKDARDAWQHLKFLLGFSNCRPAFGRYSYLEKFEYLAVIWGLIMMGLSGLALWFPEMASHLVPRWGLDALRVLHSTEAFIAMITLATGHLYAVHLNPSVFPASQVWLTGHIDLGHLADEHPLEYRRLAEMGRVPAQPPLVQRSPSRLGRLAQSRWFGLVQVALYAGLFIYLLLAFIPGLVA